MRRELTTEERLALAAKYEAATRSHRLAQERRADASEVERLAKRADAARDALSRAYVEITPFTSRGPLQAWVGVDPDTYEAAVQDALGGPERG